MPEGATLSGTWTAQPSADTSIALTIQPGGTFTWQVNAKGQPRQFSGTSTFGSGVLTLVPEKMCRRSSAAWELDRSQPHDVPGHRRRRPNRRA